MTATCTPVEHIPAANYEGYLWYADQRRPEVYRADAAITPELESDTSFVVEGWLYDRAKSHSYRIRYVDGRHLLACYALPDRFEPTSYVAHKVPEVRSFRVYEHWAPRPDPTCIGFETLQYAWSAFVGFDHAKTNTTDAEQ